MKSNRTRTDRCRDIWKKTNGVCAHCGKAASSRTRTVDHYVPKSWGSGYDPRNLMPLCRECNYARGNIPINPYKFYKYAPKHCIDDCVAYEREFNAKYNSMGDL